MEAFPYRFTNGIRAIWRRRKYQRLEVPRKKTGAVTRLGDGRGRSNRRGWKLRSVFRIRVNILSPIKLLTRIRDSYVDAMMGLARRGSGLGAGSESHWSKRIPMARPVRSEPGDFEIRLIIEVYKSLLASGELVV